MLSMILLLKYAFMAWFVAYVLETELRVWKLITNRELMQLVHFEKSTKRFHDHLFIMAIIFLLTY